MQVHQETLILKKNVESDKFQEKFMDSSNGFCEFSSKNEEESENCVTSSSSSSDLEEVSSCSSPSSSPSFGPLYELSELMAQLPIKRGLSKYYHGKSESYTSFASVTNLEDLAKKGSSYSQRMKACRSYGWGLNGRKYGPKVTIKKKSPKGSFLSSRSTTSVGRCRLSMATKKNL